ncbi:fibronectin type III domain-containing protein [Parapedobacter tibetensis]|uniref:fibronectin type III domain-containing protein n=1 Tax=Parapedobacter tibetensis TaxID=2972951 RepID=UPI00214DD8F0|nr:fibronectin type III domain-containing protein [Parapedobacter tibetensis]
MKPLKVRTYYAGMSEHELVTQAGKVLQFMTANANFPTPVPDLAVFEAGYIDYKTKLEKANRGGSRLDFREKKEARIVLLDLMRELATHVNLTAKGVGSMLESSGFRMGNLDRNIGIPGIPQRGRLADGDKSGTFRWAVDTVADATEYDYCVGTRAGEGMPIEWDEPKTVTQSFGTELTGLTPGVTYYVRVRAHNGKGDSDWCEPFSRMAR